MANNHRIVADGNDWMRDVERRVNRQERRPAAPDINAVFGTAIRQHSRQIADWNDPEALRNGWYYTETFGINAPDSNYMWMGQCIVTYDGHGTQVLWSHGAPVLYQFVRTFHWHDNEAPDFAAWQQVYSTPDTALRGPVTNGVGFGGDTYYMKSGSQVQARVWNVNNTGVGTTQATTAFTLPVGYRPLYETYFWAADTSTGGQVAMAIRPDGTAYYVVGRASGLGVLGHVTYIAGG